MNTGRPLTAGKYPDKRSLPSKLLKMRNYELDQKRFQKCQINTVAWIRAENILKSIIS